MAIEFFCPGCGKLMRTPDPTAGRKGRCPHCSTKVQIPLTSIAPKADAPTAANPAVSRPQQPTANQPTATRQAESDPNDRIQFVCGSCQKTLRVPAASAGKKGKCPHCNSVMSIPTMSPAANQPAAANQTAAAKWKGTVSSAPIQFVCPGCQKSVRVGASAAGKQGKCPHCQTVVKIPLVTFASPRPATTPGLTPLDNSGGLTPLSGSGLTPFDSPGLTPIDSSGGLTPLGGTADPFAGTSDPLGGLTELSAPGGFPSQDPFGGTATRQPSSTNPYASPAATPSYAASARGTRRTGKRSGLPWDNKNKHKSPFIGTIKQVMFSPGEAFSSMLRSDGDSSPMLFCIFGNMIGGTFAIIYSVMFDTIPLLLSQEGGGEQAAAYFVGMIIGLVIGVVIGLVFLVIFTLIGVFINACMFHLCLMVLGGANQSFETTVRVVQYTMGSTALCAVIPFVGGFVQFIANLVIMSIGLAKAHETSGLKATFAVLIPMLLCIALVVGVVVLLAATVWSAINQG